MKIVVRATHRPNVSTVDCVMDDGTVVPFKRCQSIEITPDGITMKVWGDRFDVEYELPREMGAVLARLAMSTETESKYEELARAVEAFRDGADTRSGMVELFAVLARLQG